MLSSPQSGHFSSPFAATKHDKTLKHIDMKKQYLLPEVEIHYLVLENDLLFASTNGENLKQHTYGDYYGEDEDDFWM